MLSQHTEILYKYVGPAAVVKCRKNKYRYLTFLQLSDGPGFLNTPKV